VRASGSAKPASHLNTSEKNINHEEKKMQGGIHNQCKTQNSTANGMQIKMKPQITATPIITQKPAKYSTMLYLAIGNLG
jgi:hypothetical protein